MIQMSNKTQKVTGINVRDSIKFFWHTKAAFCCHCAQLCRASFAVTADTPCHGKHVWLHVRTHVCVCSQLSEFIAGYLEFNRQQDSNLLPCSKWLWIHVHHGYFTWPQKKLTTCHHFIQKYTMFDTWHSHSLYAHKACSLSLHRNTLQCWSHSSCTQMRII